MAINPLAFDVINFGINVINNIDAVRATTNTSGITSNESRINAFYRLIGLPSIFVTSANNSQINASSISIDPMNTANVFQATQVLSGTQDLAAISQVLSSREVAYFIYPGQNEQLYFLDNNQLPLSCGVQSFGTNYTILPDIVQTGNIRTRGSLFPMIVNGNLLIRPQQNRVGNAFLTDAQLNIAGNQYIRPFIETVISIVLSGQNISNSTLSNELITSFGLTNANVSANQTSSSIIQSILNILETLPSIVSQTCYDLGILRDQDNNNLSITPDQIAGQNMGIIDFIGDSSEQGSQIQLQSNIVSQQNLNNLLYTLINYDDTNDTSSITQNAQVAGLASDFYYTITDDLALDNQEILTEETINNMTNQIEATTIKLDMLLGQFSSLSVVDILVVFLALFLLPQNQLLGLLNDDSINNLNTIKFGGKQQFSRPGTVDTMLNSVTALQNLVKNIYTGIDNNVNNTVIAPTSSTQPGNQQ